MLLRRQTGEAMKPSCLPDDSKSEKKKKKKRERKKNTYLHTTRHWWKSMRPRTGRRACRSCGGNRGARCGVEWVLRSLPLRSAALDPLLRLPTATHLTTPHHHHINGHHQISTKCNEVYAANFPAGPEPLTKDILHLSVADLDAFDAGAWLLSPPCQVCLVCVFPSPIFPPVLALPALTIHSTAPLVTAFYPRRPVEGCGGPEICLLPATASTAANHDPPTCPHFCGKCQRHVWPGRRCPKVERRYQRRGKARLHLISLLVSRYECRIRGVANLCLADRHPGSARLCLGGVSAFPARRRGPKRTPAYLCHRVGRQPVPTRRSFGGRLRR